MDATAISLCMDNRLPIVVFNLKTPGRSGPSAEAFAVTPATVSVSVDCTVVTPSEAV